MAQAPVQEQKDVWMPMMKVPEVIHMHANTLNRFVKRHHIPTRRGRRDYRKVFVNVSAIQRILSEDE